MALSVAAQRTVRAFVHYAVGALTAIPALIPTVIAVAHGTPVGDKLAVFAGVLLVWTTAIAGLLNKLEQKFPNAVPAWLRDEVPSVFEATPGLVQPTAFDKLEKLVEELPDPPAKDVPEGPDVVR